MTGQEMFDEMILFFSTPGLWCKGACARDINGLPISPLSADAVQWDMYGYLIKKNFDENGTVYDELLAAHRIVQSKIDPMLTTSRDIEKINDEFADETELLAFLNS